MSMYAEKTLNEIQDILVDHCNEPELYIGDWKKLPLLQEMQEAWAWEVDICNGSVLELKAHQTQSGHTEAFELDEFIWGR